MEETVEVPHKKGTCVLERKLKSRPVYFREKVTYNVEPAMSAYTISFSPVQEKPQWKPIKDNDVIAPGHYFFRVAQNGYQEKVEKRSVYPSEVPFSLEIQLEALLVPVYVKIEYDALPPENLPPYRLIFAKPLTGERQQVKDKEKVTPGAYLFYVEQEGYIWEEGKQYYQGQKKIHIEPGLASLWIKETLKALPRRIQPVFKFEGEVVEPMNVMLGDRAIEKPFQVGIPLNLFATFRQYAPVRKTLTIPPGAGFWQVVFPLMLPKTHSFFSVHQYVIQDGIKYLYGFATANGPIESYWVSVQEQDGQFLYTIKYEPDTHYLLIFGGYRYQRYSVESLPMALRGRFPNISIHKLMRHLDKIMESTDGKSKALEIVSSIVLRPKELKQLQEESKKDIQSLKQYLASWQFEGSEEQQKLQKILATLHGL
jgi:hypothetical protein